MSQLATELPSPAPASGTSPGRPSLPAFALHLVTLYALAVAQPLFSLLAKNPEFFAARDLGRGAVIGLTLALILLPPLPAVLVGAAARRLGSTRLQQLCDALLVAAPTALLVLYAGRGSTSPLASGPLALATAPLVALAFAWLYQRRAEVRLFVSYLSIAVLAVPAVFLFGVWPLGAPEAPAPVAPGPAAASVPLIPTAPKTIVLIVFDEMSGQSLLDAEHRIDAARFPNLAALAATSSWYRNATAASDATVTAVPAILTGRKPRIAQLATLAYHPDNLFTRLGGRYQVIAREYLTHLCPGDCNGPNEAPPPADTSVSSIRLLAEDLGIVYLHLVVPRPYDQRLPPVGSDWSGFAGTQRYDYPRDFRSFLATLKSGPPTLYVLHTHLPHQPYEYLPSGKSYQLSAPLLRPDPRAYRGQIEMVYRRYLLQLGLVDRLVGELIDQLRSERLFDQSLLIVTADHGPRYVRRSAFAKGGDPADAYTPIYLRGPGDSAAQSEWALVPFLVKRPDQHEGEISDAPVANIDIVPTILQAAGLLTDAASDPRLEGFPLDQAPPDRLRRVFLSGKNIPLAADLLEERDRILAWKLATFGDGSDPDAIYQKASPRPDLLGRPIASLPPNPTGLRIVLDDAEGATKTFSYDPASRWIPTLVKGTVISERALTEPGPVVAIAVDGIIRATVRAHAVEEGRWRFEVLVPEEAVSAGSLLTVQLVSDLPVTADAG